jgi:glucosamine-phosphate N-acetyltransferase
MAEQDLFAANYLSPEVQAALPQGYKLRALQRNDYDAGFLDCLRVLTTVGDISKEKWEERYDWIAKQDGSYFIIVIEDTNVSPPRIVGTGALLAERKL